MDIKYSWDSYQRIADPCTLVLRVVLDTTSTAKKGFRFDNCDLYNSNHILCYTLFRTIEYNVRY